MPIVYRKIEKYKYLLEADAVIQTEFRPVTDIHLEYLSLTKTGLLGCHKSYAWNGPNKPAIDTKNFRRGSLFHDAIYQLMRMGLLPMTCKDAGDRLLQAICIEDGMWRIRAWWVYQGVHLFGAGSSKLTGEKEFEILTAP